MKDSKPNSTHGSNLIVSLVIRHKTDSRDNLKVRFLVNLNAYKAFLRQMEIPRNCFNV